MIKGKVENIKDKIDGNELDLSLSNLTEVPVKELVSVWSIFMSVPLFTCVFFFIVFINIDFCAGCISKGNVFGSVL